MIDSSEENEKLLVQTQNSVSKGIIAPENVARNEDCYDTETIDGAVDNGGDVAMASSEEKEDMVVATQHRVSGVAVPEKHASTIRDNCKPEHVICTAILENNPDAEYITSSFL
mmetsp:Transcript_20242/g.48676  ORF Transcript_20242/g.48676 Transcript_20242/m.48676 type:complete len:113 (-) Transcript_20242:311-649(-)